MKIELQTKKEELRKFEQIYLNQLWEYLNKLKEKVEKEEEKEVR
jgi:hypothetical protein